ncbi:MJ0042 family finger-like domain-containing protein [Natrinema salaciae]|uniref:MJ0042 family finger-like domain-containing protein n=1 Tax=Natrinema salaciae TaxID=1186196 RepID=A0A1H9FP96_9EURY|nr:MJ0042 family finger-like domain-containing protein [Natrinema salaciae]
MNARCPDCGSGFGELLEKYVANGEVIADFRCSNCGHEWSLSL